MMARKTFQLTVYGLTFLVLEVNKFNICGTLYIKELYGLEEGTAESFLAEKKESASTYSAFREIF